ncbi:Tyrosine-protein kinase JAK2 [Actinacidiphila bryophytorum]|uniref:Tyrosine-protein kinase JAK2 n=1 Tax=Actinacidiphila bryophytorum TaxID=1436133 RepID=A0A9W4MGI0_9ACTN|nr:Tyrosine-protein kinase JAK2 [Actinacidiphila bryophytorum]
MSVPGRRVVPHGDQHREHSAAAAVVAVAVAGRRLHALPAAVPAAGDRPAAGEAEPGGDTRHGGPCGARAALRRAGGRADRLAGQGPGAG